MKQQFRLQVFAVVRTPSTLSFSEELAIRQHNVLISERESLVGGANSC